MPPTREPNNIIKYFSRSAMPLQQMLSNFSPSKIVVGGREFPTVEHAYQAQKSDDRRWKDRFTPGKGAYCGDAGGQAKSAGNWKKLKDLGLRSAVGFHSRTAMKQLLRLKFRQNPELAVQLLSTGGYELRHAGWRIDEFWGCKYVDEKRVGDNVHGRLLMKVRGELGGIGEIQADFDDQPLPPILALERPNARGVTKKGAVVSAQSLVTTTPPASGETDSSIAGAARVSSSSSDPNTVARKSQLKRKREAEIRD